MQKNLKQLRAAGIEPVSISYDSPEKLSQAKKQLNIDLTLLSDPKSQVIAQYSGVDQSAQGRPSYGFAYPTTFLVGQDGKILAVIQGTTRKRPRAADLLKAAGK